MHKRRKNLSIIIPMAGLGRRMKSHGPKPLIEISGRETVIGRQLRILKSTFPLAEIITVVGHGSDLIMRALPAWVKIVENERYEETNVVRSIGMGLRVASHKKVLIVYGDLVFNAAAVEWARFGGSAVLVESCGQLEADEVGVMTASGIVTNFSYGLPIKWGQIVCLSGRELNLFKKIVWSAEHARYFGFEALNLLVDAGGKLQTVEPAGLRLVELDSWNDIAVASRVDNPDSRTILVPGGRHT